MSRTLDEALERIRDLEHALGKNYQAPPGWRLTPSETIMLGLLVRREFVANETIRAALYDGRDRATASVNTIKVLMSKMRKKIGIHGIIVQTNQGSGYWIDRSTRLLLSHSVGDGITSTIAEADRLTAEMERIVRRLKFLTDNFSKAIELAETTIVSAREFTSSAKILTFKDVA